jgi:hypothetical protein
MGRPLRGAVSIEVGRGVFGRRGAVDVLKTTFFGRSEAFGLWPFFECEVG